MSPLSPIISYLEYLPDPIWLLDAEGNCKFLNEAGRSKLSIPHTTPCNATVNSFMKNVVTVDEKKVSKKTFPFYVALKDNKAQRNVMIKTQDGDRSRFFLTNAVPIEEDGKITAVLMSFKDITRQYRQQELQKMFIKTVGHELKQPLGLIRAYTYYIQKIFNDNQITDLTHIKKINSQVTILTQMLDDIADATRFTMNTFKISPKSINGSKLIKDLITDLQAIHQERTISFLSNLKDDEGNIKVDPVRFRQAVSNVISNALKYSPSDQEVQVELSQDTDAFTIVIRDKGMGMTSEEQSAIFEPFYRSQRANEVGRGLGLGLAFVKNVIDRHGGSILVKSTPKKGSEFTIQIPH